MDDPEQREQDRVHDADDTEDHPEDSHCQPVFRLFERAVDPMFEPFDRPVEIRFCRQIRDDMSGQGNGVSLGGPATRRRPLYLASAKFISGYVSSSPLASRVGATHAAS